jgi:hypothetical protein
LQQRATFEVADTASDLAAVVEPRVLEQVHQAPGRPILG